MCLYYDCVSMSDSWYVVVILNWILLESSLAYENLTISTKQGHINSLNGKKKEVSFISNKVVGLGDNWIPFASTLSTNQLLETKILPMGRWDKKGSETNKNGVIFISN